MTTSAAPRRFLSRARVLLVTVGFGIYAVALVFAVRRWELPDFNARALAFLALALTFELFAKVVFAGLFRVGLDAVDHPLSWRAAISAALTGSAVARLLPAGGALTPSTMALTVKNEEADTAGAAVRVTMLTYAGLLVMTGLGLMWITTEGPHPVLFAGALLLGVALTVAGLVVLAGATWLDRLVRLLPRPVAAYLAPTSGGGRVTPVEAALVAMRVTSEAAVLWAGLEAFGISLSPSEVFVAHGLSMLIGGLPGLPGGLGIVEGGIIGVLSAYGYSTGSVVAPVLVYRIVDYWIPAGIGLVVFWVISRRVVKTTRRGFQPGVSTRHPWKARYSSSQVSSRSPNGSSSPGRIQTWSISLVSGNVTEPTGQIPNGSLRPASPGGRSEKHT